MNATNILKLWLTLCFAGLGVVGVLGYVTPRSTEPQPIKNIEDRLSKLEAAIAAETEARALDVSMFKAELVKRDDVIEKLTNQVEANLNREECKVEIAFFAKIGSNVANLARGQIIVFDQTITDIDSTNSLGSYNRISGIFTAPIDGLYVFSTTMQSLNKESTHHAIYQNNVQITTIYLHGGDINTSDSTSQTVVVSLRRADTVTVRHKDSNRGAYGGGHSLFSGFLLKPHVDCYKIPS